MHFNHFIIYIYENHLITVLVCCLFFIGCKDDKANSNQYDPSQPVVFTDFSPKEGGMRTRLYIEGSNFGNDPTKIHITIGGEKPKPSEQMEKRFIAWFLPRLLME